MAGLDINNPIRFTTALNGFNVIPGDTIVLRGGTYPNTYISKFVGTAENRITIKPYNNERVIIDGGFSEIVAAQYVDYVDLEFTWSGWADRIGPYTTVPTSISDNSASFSGSKSRLINCTIHDAFLFDAWDNVELVYGCISYSNGLASTVRQSWGHALYAQNTSVVDRKSIKHNVFGRCANYGLHAFATSYQLSGIDIVENVIHGGNSQLVGSMQADNDVVFNGNHAWDVIMQLGYGSYDHTLLECKNNILYCSNNRPLQLLRWISGDISGNTLVCDSPAIVIYLKPTEPDLAVIDSNTYYNLAGTAACFATNGVAPYALTIETWRAMYGHDANSTISLTSDYPDDSVSVYPNEYASVSKRKGLVVIHNWSGADTVSVDLSEVAIGAGSTYKLINSQDPLVDVATGVMPADKILSIDMREVSHTVASVDGWSDTEKTFPMFGCFILEI